MKALNSFLSI